MGEILQKSRAFGVTFCTLLCTHKIIVFVWCTGLVLVSAWEEKYLPRRELFCTPCVKKASFLSCNATLPKWDCFVSKEELGCDLSLCVSSPWYIYLLKRRTRTGIVEYRDRDSLLSCVLYDSITADLYCCVCIPVGRNICGAEKTFGWILQHVI